MTSEDENELDFLRWFYINCDFGPADEDVRAILIDEYKKETGRDMPSGYDWREADL
jgi:hypothetical protein